MPYTIDSLAEEIREPVFRLLRRGRVKAAAELVFTYAHEANQALWAEVLGENTYEAITQPIVGLPTIVIDVID